MDRRSADQSMTLRKSPRVVLWLSGFLDEPEREAVLGDLTERGASGGRAIADILGLVVRRRTAILFDLRLWVAVAFLVLPVSYLLSAIAQTTAGEGAVYSWMYLNNWDWTLTSNHGFWLVFRETVTNFAITCLVLACWAWSAGFLIGRLPSAILPPSRSILVVLLVVSFLSDVPARLIQLWMVLHGFPLPPALPDVHAPITANVFYRVFFPWIILAILVILPAFSGIQQGNKSLPLDRKMRRVLVTAGSISLLVLLTHAPGFGLLLGGSAREWLRRNQNAMQVLPLLCCWPIFYWIAIGFGRHRHHKAAIAQ